MYMYVPKHIISEKWFCNSYDIVVLKIRILGAYFLVVIISHFRAMYIYLHTVEPQQFEH